jgi:hypothetical protein
LTCVETGPEEEKGRREDQPGNRDSTQYHNSASERRPRMQQREDGPEGDG